MGDEDRIDGEVPGDGGAEPVAKSELQKFKDEIAQLCTDAASGVLNRREWSDRTRYCKWEGQSEDGRKYAANNGGKPVFPFEGASDGRLRVADQVVNERVAMLTTAATRVIPKVVGMEANDTRSAGHMKTLYRWLVVNQLGSRYRRELKKLAQFQEGDSPGGAVLGVFWDQQPALTNQELSVEDLAEYLVATFPDNVDQAMVDDVVDMVTNPARVEQGVEFLVQLIPELKKSRARKVLQQFREEGIAQFPRKYLRVNLPRLQAYRLFQDIFFPHDTQDLENARVIFCPEWLTEVQLKSRKESHKYDEAFVNKALEHKGKSGFPLLYSRSTGETSVKEYEAADPQLHREQYEIVTAFFPAVNEDWVRGWYTLTFSCQVDVPATKRTLLDYDHGQSPFTYFQREVLTQQILDTRGCPELAATDQSNLKLLNDSFLDHAQMSTLPPLNVPMGRGKFEYVVAPAAQNAVGREKPDYLKGPEYPQTNVEQQALIARRVNQYFGRISDDVPELLATILMQCMVDDFLWSLKDALMKMLQLCQQYMDDDQILRVVGGSGTGLARGLEEIQGKFDLELTFDVRGLDIAYIKELAKTIREMVMPLDKNQTLKSPELVAWLVESINPNLADRIVERVEVSDEKEIQDEETNFVKMLAGMEPPMRQEGQNFGLRLRWLDTEVERRQQYARMYEPPSPVSRELIGNRRKHLEFMVQQQANAETGRVGAEPVMG